MPKIPTVIDVEKHYWARMRAFERETVGPGGIVLVGSSHFEWFDTDRFLPGYRIINRGVAGDRLGITDRGVLHRLDVSVFNLKPALIVFNNGVNDLGELQRTGEPTIEQIRDIYERVVAAIRLGEPDTPMLIVNEMPTTGRFAGVNPFIPVLNEHIASVAQRHGCEHLDMHGELVSDTGELRVELTWDGLHLNEVGYELLAEKLTPLLRSGVS